MTDEEKEAAIEYARRYLKSQPIFPECFSHQGGQRLTIQAAKEWAQSLVGLRKALELDGPSLTAMISRARENYAPAHEALLEAMRQYTDLRRPPPIELVCYFSEHHSPKYPSKALQGEKVILLNVISLVCALFHVRATRDQPVGDDEVGGRDCGCSLVAESLKREGIKRPRESGLAKLWGRRENQHLKPDLSAIK